MFGCWRQRMNELVKFFQFAERNSFISFRIAFIVVMAGFQAKVIKKNTRVFNRAGVSFKMLRSWAKTQLLFRFSEAIFHVWENIYLPKLNEGMTNMDEVRYNEIAERRSLD